MRALAARALLLTCALGPAAARADSTVTSEVIGGTNAKAGAWPDVAAILFPSVDDEGNASDEALCTGTLIAPTIMLTAGHCYDADAPPLPDNVLVGATSLALPEAGETLAIARAVVYPDPDHTEDLTVLVLAKASSRTPRKLATGWARFDIVDGAKVAIVGYGAVSSDGGRFINELQEARSTITDADCSDSVGCNLRAQPAGELGAGGMGIDSCPGDSGGPLYLETSYGTFLAGVTSRSYDDATVSCSEGGIYARPDKVVDWIEEVAGVPVARGPEPSVETLVAVAGNGGDAKIDINDPSTGNHVLEIVTQPAHGEAAARSDGAVRMCAAADAPAGADSFVVRITDAKRAARTLDITVPVEIQAGAAATTPCDVTDFPDDGGCCDAGRRRVGAIPLSLAVLVVLRRRRR